MKSYKNNRFYFFQHLTNVLLYAPMGSESYKTTNEKKIPMGETRQGKELIFRNYPCSS